MAPGLTSVSRPTISLFALPVSAVEFSKQRVRDRLAEEAEALIDILRVLPLLSRFLPR